MDEHRHIAVEVGDAAVLHAKRQQVADPGDAFWKKWKLGLGHGSKPIGWMGQDAKGALAQKGIFAESAPRTKPTPSFQS
jgi:hypothetical protein